MSNPTPNLAFLDGKRKLFKDWISTNYMVIKMSLLKLSNKSIAFFLMFCIILSAALIPNVYAESLDEAILRSGVVVGYVCIPSPLVAGETYTIRWMSQAYVPIISKIYIRYSDGSNDAVDGILYDTKRGGYHIVDRYSTEYYFEADYTVPVGNSGDTCVGFYHAQDDQEDPFWMFGLFPTGVVRRPYGVAGKNFNVTILDSFSTSCKQDDKGGQCVVYARNYFGGSYEKMPALSTINPDFGAYNAWGHWDLGFGSGQIPEAPSIMLIDKSPRTPLGHLAVVTGVSCNSDGTCSLKVQESNWDEDEKIDCDVIYTFRDCPTITQQPIEIIQ